MKTKNQQLIFFSTKTRRCWANRYCIREGEPNETISELTSAFLSSRSFFLNENILTVENQIVCFVTTKSIVNHLFVNKNLVHLWVLFKKKHKKALE